MDTLGTAAAAITTRLILHYILHSIAYPQSVYDYGSARRRRCLTLPAAPRSSQLSHSGTSSTPPLTQQLEHEGKVTQEKGRESVGIALVHALALSLSSLVRCERAQLIHPLPRGGHDSNGVAWSRWKGHEKETPGPSNPALLLDEPALASDASLFLDLLQPAIIEHVLGPCERRTR